MKYHLKYHDSVFDVEAEPYSRVSDLRLQAEQHFGLQENTVVLFYGNALEERKCLGQVGIRPGATILVYPRPGSNSASRAQNPIPSKSIYNHQEPIRKGKYSSSSDCRSKYDSNVSNYNTGYSSYRNQYDNNSSKHIMGSNNYRNQYNNGRSNCNAESSNYRSKFNNSSSKYSTGPINYRNQYNNNSSSKYNTESNKNKGCSLCKDKRSQKCTRCGCGICFDKNPENLIHCTKCPKNYHTQCLHVSLNSIPKSSWVCSECIKENGHNPRINRTQSNHHRSLNNSNSSNYHRTQSSNNLVRDSNVKLEPSSTSISNGYRSPNSYQNTPITNNLIRDTNEISDTKPPKKIKTENKFHLGKIPGVPVGTSWEWRKEVAEAGVHRPHIAGISGNNTDGAESIVLAGGYIDDEDYGNEFIYTGSGGSTAPLPDPNKKEHQELTRYNYALALNCDAPINNVTGAKARDWRNSKPVRVIRNFRLKKYHPDFAPISGNRYDGLYKLVSYRPEKSKHANGSIVWRFLFRRDDEEPAPWTPEGLKRSMELGLIINAILNTSTQKIPSTSSLNQSSNYKNTQNSNQNENNGSNENNNVQFVQSFNNLNIQNNPYEVSQFTMYNRKRLNQNEDRRGSTGSNDKMNRTNINSNTNSHILASSSTSPDPSHKVCSNSRYTIPDDIQDLIYSDTQNGVIWENIIEAEDEIQFAKMVLCSFKCPMCFELVNNPLTTKCGHNICLGCLKARYYDIDNKCPTCKSIIFSELENISEQKKIELTKDVINNYPVNTTLNTILNRIFPSRDLNGSVWS